MKIRIPAGTIEIIFDIDLSKTTSRDAGSIAQLLVAVAQFVRDCGSIQEPSR